MNINDYPYINKIEYLLHNLEKYDLSYQEALLCMTIIYYNEHHLNLTYDDIALKLKISTNDIDLILQNLITKNYLEIKVNGHISFNLDKLFSDDKAVDESTYSEMLKLCENVFNRVLNMTELTILNELVLKYPKEKIIEALRSAEVYQKGEINMFYIKGILNNDND